MCQLTRRPDFSDSNTPSAAERAIAWRADFSSTPSCDERCSPDGRPAWMDELAEHGQQQAARACRADLTSP
jgi:hypothetical protein